MSEGNRGAETMSRKVVSLLPKPDPFTKELLRGLKLDKLLDKALQPANPEPFFSTGVDPRLLKKMKK